MRRCPDCGFRTEDQICPLCGVRTKEFEVPVHVHPGEEERCLLRQPAQTYVPPVSPQSRPAVHSYRPAAFKQPVRTEKPAGQKQITKVQKLLILIAKIVIGLVVLEFVAGILFSFL